MGRFPLLQRRIRIFIGVGLIASVFAALSVYNLHKSPPLRATVVGMVRDNDNHHVYGITLQNNGRWPVTLVTLDVNGRPAVEDVLALVSGGDGEIAGSVALKLEEKGFKAQTGPVLGWEVPPQRELPALTSHGIRLVTSQSGPRPVNLTLHYKTVGFPMTLQVDLEGLQLGQN